MNRPRAASLTWLTIRATRIGFPRLSWLRRSRKEPNDQVQPLPATSNDTVRLPSEVHTCWSLE